MKKNYLLSISMLALFLLANTILAEAQSRYATRNGKVTFFSSTPMENIEAKNNKVNAVVDAGSNKLQFAVLIKAFKFEKALMEEHFNENYMESSTYPKATFKGAVVKPDNTNLAKNGTHKVTVKGKMTIHGVTKEVEVPGTVTKTDDNMNIAAEFMVKPEDYGIKIPGAVKDNIAKEIKVNANMDLAPMGK